MILTIEPNDFKAARTLHELASEVCSRLRVSGSLVTRVTEDRQFVLANAGFELPDRFSTSMPINYSICQHTVAMDFPLVIDNTVMHPLLQDNLAFSELRVGAYLGAPVHSADGETTGAICAVEFHRRRWSEQDIELIRQAAIVADRLLGQSG